MIQVSGLTRYYGDFAALDGVSFDVAEGEIVGLLGLNGAGKSTTLRILAGLTPPSSGTVRIDGVDTVADPGAMHARIGFLPETPPLYDDMTVADFVGYIGRLKGMSAADVASRLPSVLATAQLTDRADQVIRTLSHGYRKRVGIAQAIVHDPAVLVFDEPTNGLDPVQIQSIRILLKELGKTSTVILSTHILQEVEAVCDRVLVMIGGRLVADAPLRDFTTSRTVRLVLGATANDAARALAGVEGVVDVSSPTAAPEGTVYSIRFTGDQPPVPGILAVASKAGWEVRAVAPEVRTLDMAFQELQNQQLRAAEAGVA